MSKSQADRTILTDEQIVERILKGEKQLYEKLMRKYDQRLFRIGRSIINDEHRSPDSSYVTQGLAGLWTHMKGGFYHDGRFATLMDVVNHYNNFKNFL